jgi:hypothetical protein
MFIVNLSDNFATWSQQGKLYIMALKAIKLNIYTTSGVLVKHMSLTEGETTSVSMSRGVYIVVPNDGKTKKVLVY